MNKEGNIRYDIHEVLKKRWSPRAFAAKMVEKEKIDRMLEAARWSPSSSNKQPWSFIIGEKGSKTYDKIFDTLVEFNQLWTKFAPLLIITVGKQNNTYQYDVGQSVAHLTFQASHDGLFVHQMAGFSPEKARKFFDIPEFYDALTAIAVGYIGDYTILPERMQKSELAERERKEINEFVFSEKFGKISHLI